MRLLTVVVTLFVVAFSQSLPPSGLYLVLRSDFINQLGQELSIQVSDEANAYRNAPVCQSQVSFPHFIPHHFRKEVDGSNSDVTYRLYQWIFDIDLGGFTTAITSLKTAKIIWTDFTWIIQFNYHISSNNLPVSESGWIQVYTTSAGPTTLEVDLDVDLTGYSFFFFLAFPFCFIFFILFFCLFH